MEKLKRRVKRVAKEVETGNKKKLRKKKKKEIKQVLSTGSTLLDLCISGKRVYGGGVPGGIIMEVFGPSGVGKTAVLVELAASAQDKGGLVRFDDPEARLDREYSRLFGMQLKDSDYYRPDTVKEMFNGLWGWDCTDKSYINVSCADSLAALSTEMEMEDQDKMGMKRAKDFSEGLRKTCRLIAKNNWLIVCSNQEREGNTGIVTPGGRGIPYYSSLRIRLTAAFPKGKIVTTKTINGKKIEKVTGIRSKCQVRKNSIDEPYGECNISITFGYGIDDIRENLIYIKELTGEKKYVCPDDTKYAAINKAIEYVEDNDLEGELKKQVIELWHEVQDQFKINRKRKKRC